MEEAIKSKWYRRKWVWIVGIFLLFVFIGSAMEEKPPISAISAPIVASTTPLEGTSTAVQTAPISNLKSISNTQTISVQPRSNLVKVVKVIDGDTLDVDISGKTTRLRLIGIDTPEVVDPRKPVQCFGREASAKAKELLSGQSVRLEADLTQGELDKYGRTLRYVFLPDGQSFNKLMIEEGYAHEYTYNTPYHYQIEYKAAQKAAEASKRGLWADNACSMTVTAPAQAVVASPGSSLTVSQTSSGHTYYVSSYHTARYFYCDSDPSWKGLSSKYIKSFASEAELLKAFPDKTLHENCN